MNIFSLLAISIMVIQLELGFSALRLDPRSPLNRSFFIICFLSCLWALGYAFMYPQVSPQSMFWYRVSALGWCILPAAVLVFMLHLADAMPRHKILVSGLIYLPGIIVLAKALSGTVLAYDFADGPWGAYEIQEPFDPFYILFSIHNLCCTAIGVLVVLYKARASHNRIKLRQARLIISGFVFSIAFALSANILVPFLEMRFPSIGVLGTIISLTTMRYVITHYKLMTLTPDIAVQEILEGLSDLVFLLDKNGRIIETNTQVTRLLNCRVDQLLHRDFSSLVQETDLLASTRQRTQTSGETGFSLYCILKGCNSLTLPVSLTWSNISDRFGEPTGSVIVAHDLRNIRLLEQEVRKSQQLMLQLEEERNKLHTRNQIIETELALARNIQKRLIPQKPPNGEIAVWYQPMDMVGGDFFDFVDFADGRTVGIFVSDVSGHGVPAAFITSMIKSAGLQMAPRLQNTAALLHYLNDFLISLTDENFVTAFYGIFDRVDRSFRYASAGHNEPYLISPAGNTVQILEDPNKGLPLAILTNKELKARQHQYAENQVFLESGSKILLYTDGLVETTSANDLKLAFGDSLIHDVIKEHGQKPAQSFVLRIKQALIDFHGSKNFDDDICLICLDVP